MSRYEDYQAEKDREYARAWDKLTDQGRQDLLKAGVAGPEVPKYRTGKGDASAVIEQSQTPASDEPLQTIEADEEAGQLLKEFLFRIVEERHHPRLEAECISLAFGFGAARGLTLTEVADRYGLTRAAVSKRVREIAEQFGLPASSYMKSDRARRVYRLTNKSRA